jgi:Predicted acyltransferases
MNGGKSLLRPASAPSRLGGVSQYQGIQALRFVAALLVAVTHSTFYAHERLNPDLHVWRPGAIGVDMFFIISGFVMMASSQSILNAPNGWRDFAAKRILRIVPMYWLATTMKIALILIIPSMVLHAELSPWRIFSSYLFLPSTNPEGRFEPLVGVGWTLLFEMFFYAVFAAALFLKVRVVKFVGSLLLAFCVIGFFRTSEWPAATMYFDPVVSYFLVGMLYYHLAQRIPSGVLAGVAGITLSAIFIAVYLFELPVRGAANSAAAFGIACSGVLLVIAAEPWLKNRIPRVVLFFGEASYVLYLFHPFISPAVPEAVKRLAPELITPVQCVVLSVIAALVGAAIIHVLIERPLTRALKKSMSPLFVSAMPSVGGTSTAGRR